MRPILISLVCGFFSWKELVTMRNKAFILLSKAEKKMKLKNVLRLKSRGKLKKAEIRSIISLLPANIQFTVIVYRSPDDFSDGIELSGGYMKRMVLGAEYIFRKCGKTELSEHHTAAITTRKCENGEVTNVLHVYIPEERYGIVRRRYEV